jgi:hypothetical protein
MDFSIVHNIFEGIRKGIMFVSEKIATPAEVPTINIFYLIIIAISLYITHKILRRFWTSYEGRWGWFFGIAAAIAGVIIFV